MKKSKVLSFILSLVMVVCSVQFPALAAEGTTYKDGTYTKTAKVQDVEEDFTNYDLSIDVVITDGVISSVSYSKDNTYGVDEEEAEDNVDYCEDAMYGYTKKGVTHVGLAEQLVGKNSLDGVDTVSKATCSSNAIILAVTEALEEARVEEKVSADKTALVKAMDITALKEKDYTADSWKVLTDAITSAKTVLDNANATQEEVDAAVVSIESAIKELEKAVVESHYVLMNIPYDEFYAAEGVAGVDVVSTATVKTYNQNMAGGSYHDGYEAADPISDAKILGVTYPVLVADMSVLEGLTVVTDDDIATITVASGKSSTVEKEVTGKDLLFASGTYAYYVLGETPTSYKTLTVDGEKFTFAAANAEAKTGSKMEAELSYGGHYTDIEFAVSADEITDTCTVNAITLTTSDGEEYALRHVEDIWRKTSLGWNWDSLDGKGLEGKTITKVTYYIVDNGEYAIYEYAVNETVKLNPGEVTASFEDANTINLTGLPADIENPVATVKTVIGRGETATVIAEEVDVVNGVITTTEDAVKSGYTITITSDNYGDISTSANYNPGYVLMNIPYDEFYAAEGVSGVDAVSTATVKTYNQNMAGGSYHEGYAAADPISEAEILGVTYPVFVADMSVLEGLTVVTDESAATITVASGKSSTVEKEVTGKDLLFASGDYAYYVLAEQPTSYKTLTVDGKTFTFAAAGAEATEATDMEVEMSYGGHYTDIEFNVTAAEITDTCTVNAITLTTSDGEEYALRHVEDIWRKTSLGWNWDSLDGKGLEGKTITKVTYYIVDNGEYAIYEYAVNETVKLNPGEVTASFEDANTINLTGLPADIENPVATVKTVVGRGETATVIAEEVDVVNGVITTTEDAVKSGYTITITSDNYGDISTSANYNPGYVLMNIPYDEFYAAEGVSGVDAVSTATVKTYNQNMAGGSYHEGYAAADPISEAEILGVTYPVYVADMSVLEGLTVVTDDDTATITVASGKSSTVEKEVTGKDLLFASGTYAYYVLGETPTSYKTLTVDGEKFTFAAANAEAKTGSKMEAELSYGGHYTDIEFAVSADEITDTCTVNAITLTTSDGEEYALRHVEDIWRKTSLGWNWDSLDGNGLAGKTITTVTYYIVDNGEYAIYEYAVNETVKLNPGEVTASFEDANTINLTGLPADIENPVATVKTVVGRGETATVIAEEVEVVDGKIITTDAAVDGTSYSITITSDNYGDVSVTAEYVVVPEDTEDDTTAGDDTNAGNDTNTDSDNNAVAGDSNTTANTSTNANTTTATNVATSVQTGDTNTFGIYLAIAACAIVVAALCFKRRKRA